MPRVDEPYMPARQAAKLLKIDIRSLYAYVSRGWIRSIPAPMGRGRLYSRSDIDRLRARQRARSGHGAAAAGALRWGEPVLESSITEVHPDALSYRGHDVLGELVHLPFEQVAELLWRGSLLDIKPNWTPDGKTASSDDGIRRAFQRAKHHVDPKVRLSDFIASLALAGTPAHEDRDTTLKMARRICRAAAALAAGLPLQAARSDSIAATLAAGWRCKIPEAAIHLNAALVICADHELNPSSFVARVAASNGASLISCLEAALATHRGTRQGLAADRLEATVDEAVRSRRLAQVFEGALTRDEGVPGFGHPLYPKGDPRARFLLQLARRISPADRRVRVLDRLVAWADYRLNERPNLDCGLVALAAALRLPSGSASTLYGVGRMAGWVAHVLEQREMKFHIRPRARYVASATETRLTANGAGVWP